MNEKSITTASSDEAASVSLRERLRDLRSQLRPDEKSADPAKLRKACQDFEAVFISQIWKQMRSSVPKDGLLHSKEEESYLSMFDQELSLKMSRGGGIGLADMLYANLSDRLLNASRDTARAKPLQPLDRAELARIQAETRVPKVQAATLATLAAQHEAEMLARRIESHHGAGGDSDARLIESAKDLDEALRMVRMDADEAGR